MSLISKQINDLRAYAKDRKGELAKLVSDAADTIEELSAKLSAANMERSSQCYHGGWIPCSERLPEKSGMYIITDKDGNVNVVRFHAIAPEFAKEYWKSQTKAWMPYPEKYRGE